MNAAIEAATTALDEAQKAAEKKYNEVCDKAERDRYRTFLKLDEEDRIRKDKAYSESVLRVGAMLDAKYYEIAEESSNVLSKELAKINTVKDIAVAVAKREYAKAMSEAYAMYFNSLVDIE